MNVEIQLINDKGLPLLTREREKRPSYRGALTVFETRDHSLGRSIRVARLVSRTDGARPALLTDLQDAELLYVDKNQVRLRGFETIDGVQYAQAWDVKVS